MAKRSSTPLIALGLVALMIVAAGYGAFLVAREGDLGPLTAFMPSFTPKKAQPPTPGPPPERSPSEPAAGESAAPGPAVAPSPAPVPADSSNSSVAGPAPGTSAAHAPPPAKPAPPSNPAGSTRNPARAPFASLLQELAAVRQPDGAVVVEGRVELPEGTKLRLILRADKTMAELGMAETRVVSGGGFRSPPFLAEGRKPFPAGPCNVVILSYFNQLWQTPEVMNQVGDGGNKLAVSRLTAHKQDEFGRAGFHFEVTVPVDFP